MKARRHHGARCSERPLRCGLEIYCARTPPTRSFLESLSGSGHAVVLVLVLLVIIQVHLHHVPPFQALL
jgi:uncharacterized membrane protein